ncbi:hypothetical protein A0J61_01115 [Choanephora cucurbitarum]|uniref:Uncharacterized protein n=1 Tax=Choanephora cucurbitarum TaxID=101091 RepID=A0A1C7NNV9_9FUNG|nr:hypothetical protein A0J61_01115 [Choanephora cucurbitarum]
MLSLRYEQQDLMDVELYQLLSATFRKTTPLTIELWEHVLAPFMEKTRLREAFNDLIDNYVYDPSAYPSIDTHDDLAIISR